jgi:DNA-directed RNA polymerase specialized sigma24 family protein
MSKSTTISMQQLHAEWTELYRLARWLCRKRLVRLDGSVPPDIYDRVDEAIAHAWKLYPKLRQRRPEVPAKTALRWVCKTGVSRVWVRTRFVSTRPHPGYRDAMDGAQREEFPEQLRQPEPHAEYRETSDRTAVENIIRKLPEHLQATARLLSYGTMTKTTVAERRGICTSTLYGQINEIRRALS